MRRILVAEDDDGIREGLVEVLRQGGHRVVEVKDGAGALGLSKSGGIDIVIADLEMPGLGGLGFVQELKRACPEACVVVVAAFTNVDAAVEAMKAGAYDYITKPFSPDEIGIIVRRVEERQRLLEQSSFLKDELRSQYENFEKLMGRSPSLKDLSDTIGRIAATSAPVLIRGEAGVGKELVAYAIHYKSPRRDRPFVKVNAAGLNDMQLDSELFGHEPGALGSSPLRRRGKLELADGGTLFLAEVGELGTAIQPKLLRVLQNGEFERMGGTEPIRVDVRVVAATSRDLEKAVGDGKFRQELYYRLSAVPLLVRPLRERRDDIPELAVYFLERLNRETSKAIAGFSKAAFDKMRTYDWPGNLRELDNAVERAVVLLESGRVVEPEHVMLGTQVREEKVARAEQGGGVRDMLRELERRTLIQSLDANGWILSRTAISLGLKRSSLRYRMRKLHCVRDRGRVEAAVSVDCRVQAPGRSLLEAGRTTTKDLSRSGMKLRWPREWAARNCEFCFDWVFVPKCQREPCPFRGGNDSSKKVKDFKVDTELGLPPRPQPSRAMGEVVWVKRVSESDSYDVGIRFLDSSGSLDRDIAAYLRRIQSGRSGRRRLERGSRPA